jgi:hypothetical protein
MVKISLSAREVPGVMEKHGTWSGVILVRPFLPVHSTGPGSDIVLVMHGCKLLCSQAGCGIVLTQLGIIRLALGHAPPIQGPGLQGLRGQSPPTHRNRPFGSLMAAFPLGTGPGGSRFITTLGCRAALSGLPVAALPRCRGSRRWSSPRTSLADGEMPPFLRDVKFSLPRRSTNQHDISQVCSLSFSAAQSSPSRSKRSVLLG